MEIETNPSNIQKEKSWDKYDITRNNNQKQVIEQLQQEIKIYQEREKAFKLHMKLKDNQINTLKKEIEQIIKRDSELIVEKSSNKSSQEIIVDPLLKNEFNTIKNLIKDKQNEYLKKQDLFESLQTNQTLPSIKFLLERCRYFMKENNELYDYAEVGILENLKYENGLAKSQIDQLMIKIKEKEIINSQLESEVNDINQQVSILNPYAK